MASKKRPNSNAAYKKWVKPSTKRPKNFKTPADDLYTEQGDNYTRPTYSPKKDGTPNDSISDS